MRDEGSVGVLGADASGSPTSDLQPLTSDFRNFGDSANMTDRSPARPELLTELEDRQEQVLRQLDELNQRIEQAVSLNRLHLPLSTVSFPPRIGGS
jgi:hypothetical protein